MSEILDYSTLYLIMKYKCSHTTVTYFRFNLIDLLDCSTDKSIIQQ